MEDLLLKKISKLWILLGRVKLLFGRIYRKIKTLI